MINKQSTIEFNAAIRDYGARTISSYIFYIIFLVIFLFFVDSFINAIIIILIIIGILFLMDYFVYKVSVVGNQVFLISYLFRQKSVRPLKVYVKKVEDSNRVYLRYETNKLKLKSVLIFGENSDYVKFYELNKNNFPFSKNFIKEYIS